MSISKSKLQDLVLNQLRNFFSFEKTSPDILIVAINGAIEKCEHCFSYQGNKYYQKDGQVYFNPFHSGQYTIFLYHLSRQVALLGDALLADKVYYLNRALNSVDLYYEVELPAVFGLDHPLGSVMGRADYSDFFYFTQNCTVGNNYGVYPTFEKYVTMLAGSMVIGNCKIGRNCIISANAYVKDEDIPGNSIVFGSSPNLVIKHRDNDYFKSISLFDEKMS